MSSKQAIVSGRILLLGEKNRNAIRDFIASNTSVNGYLKQSIFGGLESDLISTPNCNYDGIIITFGASYKYIQYYWAEYIAELENILKNINFENVSLKLETGLEGTYHFFWLSKSTNSAPDDEHEFIETEKWYFGYGNRNRWGHLLESGNDSPPFKFEGFSYPLNNISNT